MMMAQGGVSLPAGYTKIEYLESDGNSYIDTAFKPNQDTRVVMDVNIKSQSSYPKVLFGARNGSTTSDASFIVWAITANGFRTDFGSESLVTTVVPTGRFVIDKNKNVTTFNGIEYTNPAYTFQCDYNIGLFTQIDVDGPDDRLSTAKLYSCKIYDNSVLVRDFIPCTNPDGISGLWDSVNDVFYKMLPAGYTRLDFIESDGTTYIDTGYKPKYNTRVVLDMSNLTEADKWILGAKSSSSSTSAEQFSICRRTATTIRSDYFGSSVSADMADTTARFTIDIDGNVVKIDGVVSIVNTAVTSGTCVYNMYLFGLNIADTSKEASAFRIYSCQIYDNGTLVRDFIPAMNASGEAGLYDLKNDVWYALKPVVTKKKNKITYEPGTYIPETGGISKARVKAEYPVTSKITVEVDTKIFPLTFTIQVGKTISNYANGSSGTITSISPTEDDTYIYTF